MPSTEYLQSCCRGLLIPPHIMANMNIGLRTMGGKPPLAGLRVHFTPRFTTRAVLFPSYITYLQASVEPVLFRLPRASVILGCG